MRIRSAVRGVGSGVVALLLFGAAPLAAQHEVVPDSARIMGVVLDAQTRHPLPGTVVRVVSLNRQDVTHEDGAFHLGPLPHGRYTVSVERLGYRRELRQVRLERGGTVRLVIELQVSAIELPGLVVTGTVTERRGDETVRPVEVITGQELARKMDITVAGTLAREPGMAATSAGPATARPVIRGLGGDRVLLLEDGARPGDLSSASADHALSIDPITAHRLEVVRGPNALLYGSNAIGGVVNVIRDEVPASAPDRPTGSVTLHGESVNDAVAAGFIGSAGVAGIAFRAEGSVRDAGDTRTPGHLLENSGLRTVSAALGAGLARSWGNAGLSLRIYDNEYGVPPQEEEEAEGEAPGDEHGHEDIRIDMRRYALHGKADVHVHVGPYTHLVLDASYTDYQHRELEGAEVGTEYALRTGAADLRATHEGWGRLSGGALGLRFDWQDYEAGGETTTVPAREFGLAGYLVEELDLAPVRLQAGARYDWRRVEPLVIPFDPAIGTIRTRDFGALSASLGGTLALTPALQLGVSAARAFRTPGIAELFSQGPHLATYSFEVGNPSLDAETGLGLDAFLRVRTNHLNGEVAAFRNSLDDYIYYRETGELTEEGLPVFQASGTDAVLTGLEASVELLVHRYVVLDGVASWVRGDRETDQGRRPLGLMPPLHGEVNVRYERPGYFVGAGWAGAARQDRVAEDEFETPTPGHGIWNATAGYRFSGFGRLHSITLRGENLTDALYFDHLSRVKELFPEPGRNVSLVYRVVF